MIYLSFAWRLSSQPFKRPTTTMTMFLLFERERSSERKRFIQVQNMRNSIFNRIFNRYLNLYLISGDSRGLLVNSKDNKIIE
jgi:hypothetical protein